MKTQRTDQADILSPPSWRALSRNPHDVRMSDDEVAAEVAWLIGTDTPSSIAHRLGFKTMEALIRFLQRADRGDLSRRLAPLSLDPVRAADRMGCESFYDLSYRAKYARRTAAA